MPCLRKPLLEQGTEKEGGSGKVKYVWLGEILLGVAILFFVLFPITSVNIHCCGEFRLMEITLYELFTGTICCVGCNPIVRLTETGLLILGLGLVITGLLSLTFGNKLEKWW